ncbi:MAG: hypothetical protein QM783_08110 [Phycisphaerales bacterium]
MNEPSPQILPPINTGGKFDDRGKPTQPHSGSEMISNITGREVNELERLIALAANALPWIAVLGVVTYVLAIGGIRYLYSAIGFALCPGVGFFVLALGIRGLILRTVRPLAGVRLSLPTVMAHGYCGACGYRIADTPRAIGDYLVCSECGAAWHGDRVTFPEAKTPVTIAALRNAALGTVTAARLKTTSAIGYLDDRKVGLPKAYCWPRGLFRSKTPPHAAAARKELNRALGIGAVFALVLVWLCGSLIGLAVWCASDSWSDRLTTVLITASVCGFFHTLVRMAKLTADQTRNTVLQHNLCPSCWSPLNDRVEFDGCRCCTECRAAWRA